MRYDVREWNNSSIKKVIGRNVRRTEPAKLEARVASLG